MFIGSCWTANFTPTMIDRHCFNRVIGNSHIRDIHEVRENGRVVYEGETTYSVDGADLVFTYFNSLGGVGRGSVMQTGDVLHFKGSMRASPDKQPQPIDSEWTVLDDDHYDVRSLVKDASTAGKDVIHFTRVK